MAWEWSHTAEAYADAETHLQALPRETLNIIFAEWQANDSDGFNSAKHDTALKEAATLSREHLTEYIWQQASEQATCTNGGWEAWLCPFGCGCHLVPFNIENRS
tara:strand:+ start:209 stop:520 length:312 start_codon:yes stop_codon:yes gene_type:complete